MNLLFQFLVRHFGRAAGLLCLHLASTVAFAGSIGFSVEFKGDQVSIVNKGTEAGYHVSLWTLDQSAKWQSVKTLSGDSAYLAQGKTLVGRRQSAPAASGLGRADPLLVTLFDQAGSRIVQLAWRQPPIAAQYSLPIERHAQQLEIFRGNANAANIVASYGITVPYEGIARLAQGFSDKDAPPDPLRHAWATGSTMTLNTGAGQGGAWLVHETASGELQVQIAPDGLERGREQTPFWLDWVRQNLMSEAAALAAVGAALLAVGLIWRRLGPRQSRVKA